MVLKLRGLLLAGLAMLQVGALPATYRQEDIARTREERARREVNERRAFEEIRRVDSRAKEIDTRPERWDWVREEEKSRTWDWLSTEARRRVSEHIGESEMESWLRREKFRGTLTCEESSSRRQGFDAVYERDGRIVVCEAKGTAGTENLRDLCKYGYGERQGTREWAEAAAEAVLDSKTSNRRERRAAEMVIDAYDAKKLDVLVFVVQHENGVVRKRNPNLNPVML